MNGMHGRFAWSLILGLVALQNAALAAAAPLDDGRSYLQRTVKAAALFAYPLHVMERTRAAALCQAYESGRPGLNTLSHRRNLATSSDRAVTTPNIDTLYSAAWLDLAQGPVTLSVPALGRRYNSVQILDMFTDTVAVIGTSSGQKKDTNYTIVGPEWRGKAAVGSTLVRSPTNDAWLIVRILVAGQDDLAAGRSAQDAFKLSTTVAPTPVCPTFEAEAGSAALFASVAAALARNPVPKGKRIDAAKARAVGIRRGSHTMDALTPVVRGAWERVFPSVLSSFAVGLGAVGKEKSRWKYPPAGIATRDADLFTRAAVAHRGLGALPLTEALYLTAVTDGEGRPLDGRRTYELSLPSHVPIRPGGFWSVTVYQVEPDGRLFLYDNPAQRFGLGDRSPGILVDNDKKVVIKFAHEKSGGHTGEWLPVPPGPFAVVFRAYLPEPSLADGKFPMPALEPL